ncbi:MULTISPECIES: porin [unclassified Sphingomonas]|uniref:porin n=1 Tax=unclassified Sphingomonas TaxID=196159 RepID=UPI0006F3CFE4|nr:MULTISPECIES: porin [unclassified Sphingomonas]KQM28650.1 porin [Sphingomonas sp. Leaf9]KQM45353.1 porin [Sphingomonas sp. Leaf11]
MKPFLPAAVAASFMVPPPASAQTVQELQRQIDELKAVIAEMKAAQAAVRAPAPTTQPPQVAVTPPPAAKTQVATAAPPAKREKWYDRIRLRGYTQLRLSEIVSGDRTAPDGVARLRSVHDSGIGDDTGFTFRRIRLVLQGDLGERVSFYLQPDFATAVSNQSVGERREGFLQLRDAYFDAFLDPDKRFRLRFGQSKVPFGWENMQSSSNRLTLDRSDAINSGVPSERDIGVVAYYTPASVDAIWKRLTDDGQKLFGNYGAFGVGIYNGQGVNREETNDAVMAVALATWPFEIGGGRVLEVGASGFTNRVQPEVRTGGVSDVAFADERIGLHAILYPAPIGFQAEWNWGRGPEYDRTLRAITTKPLHGGYVQAMARVKASPVGPFMPYARWQTYRGGWKAAVNSPRLETDEIELGIEFQPVPALELTLAYARMDRAEADERRLGRAEGDVIRTQLQLNY